MTPKAEGKKAGKSSRAAAPSCDKIQGHSLVLGVVGPSGAGKSTVCALLQARGFEVVDVDRLAKSLYEPGAGAFNALKQAFGQRVVGPDGRIDRAWLGQRVFSSPAELRRLDAVIFPLLLKTLRRSLASLKKAGRSRIVLDMAVLFKAKAESLVDSILVVQAPLEARVRRLQRSRGLSRAAAQKQAAALILSGANLSKADFLLWNRGPKGRLRAALDSYLENL